MQKFKLLSTNTSVGPNPQTYQPLNLVGEGTIEFGEKVKIGVGSSPSFWSSECYIEAREDSSLVKIGDYTWINNNFSVISERSFIDIGENCFIGHDVFIIDSDFHSIDPDQRHAGQSSASQSVTVGGNVFVGSRVIILKNTDIGAGSVIAAGSVVSGKFPPRSLIAGNPAKIVKSI
ncbi:acyltransferase [Pontixanthobacter sp.]|uniref:acyltransferase n=1 Tax=Pontixanthobacter sp. TaxID=2792078 RepID=UPI003C7C5CF8